MNTGLPTTHVEFLQIAPKDPLILFAAAGGVGLSRTIDGGANWTPANTGLASTAFTALAVDPTNPLNVYVGTTTGADKSTDGGASWAPANTGLTSTAITALGVFPPDEVSG